MQVFLDDRPIEIERPTIAAALVAARDEAERAGRVIVEIKADGAPIDDALLDAPPDEPTGTGELRMVSAEPRSLVRVTLLEAADQLERLRAKQIGASELIQSGKTSEALGSLDEIVGTWGAVRQAVDTGATLLGFDLNALEVETGGGRVPATGPIDALARALDELRRTLSESDWSSLGDVLAYDLNDQIDQWGALLRSFADAIGAAEG